ncbi:uncharacterized protein LOC124123538 isoform X1 [Haliotis rufescens]|uniref:uncharacterized protein LOC124123538 isoform X1 n=1 Tax=Haliotis rufescens TaxID=6454 RepID=UPI00201E9DAD|nr:uncharacterized protein LOC124123538 isoform X1 [Haliotis rufescens]
MISHVSRTTQRDRSLGWARGCLCVLCRPMDWSQMILFSCRYDRKWLKSVSKIGTRPIPSRDEATPKQQSSKPVKHAEGKAAVASSEHKGGTQMKPTAMQKRPAEAVQNEMAVKALKKFRLMKFNTDKTTTEENPDDHAVPAILTETTSPAAEDAMQSIRQDLDMMQGLSSPGMDQPQDQFVTRAEFAKLVADVRELQLTVANMKKKASAKRLNLSQTTLQPLSSPASQQQPVSQESSLASTLHHAPSLETSPSPSPILYNGHTIDHLRDSISMCDKLLQATKITLFQLFDHIYILNHSVSGKASNSKTVAKPPFDSRLYGALLYVLKAKFPSTSDSDITTKIHTVQKMLKKRNL